MNEEMKKDAHTERAIGRTGGKIRLTARARCQVGTKKKKETDEKERKEGQQHRFHLGAACNHCKRTDSRTMWREIFTAAAVLLLVASEVRTRKREKERKKGTGPFVRFFTNANERQSDTDTERCGHSEIQT
jgi:Zn ribbon nucleic-acid-binding protein